MQGLSKQVSVHSTNRLFSVFLRFSALDYICRYSPRSICFVLTPFDLNSLNGLFDSLFIIRIRVVLQHAFGQ